MNTESDSKKNKSAKPETAISPTRQEDFPQWYQQVIKASDMAENSPVRGCMVIRPWGYGVWENIQKKLDERIKNTGHENAYFPLFIPLSFLQKEAQHVEGFAKECAVITHHRLEEKNGKLVPTGELEEPLIVRPTSETIIGESFSRWVKSYRDLPLLINQWANVVRWEMRPRIFLRTAEFLWQEGHTVHATEEDAMEETLKMLEVYRDFAENELAIPVIVGEKTESERFPGAVKTYCIEAMMQDCKALQAGTSHYLGQNFAKSSDIQYLNQEGERVFAHTTSWGVSTRLIGGMIMVHSDDDGLRIPPRLAPKHIVIVPVLGKKEKEADVLAFADAIAQQLKNLTYHGQKLAVVVDKRDLRGGEKNWSWIKKGIPLRLEVGPRDQESNSVVLYRRDRTHRDKVFMPVAEFVEKVTVILDEIQQNYFDEAKKFQQSHMRTDIKDFAAFKEFFTKESDSSQAGFVVAKWCGESSSEELLKELKVTIRCLPLQQSGTQGVCVLTGKPATLDAVFAKSY